jgi:ketosteroid isomerase-like protein
MAEDPVAFIRRMYAAYLSDFATVLAHTDDDAIWKVNGDPELHPAFGEWWGKEGAEDFFNTVADNLAFSRFEPQEFYASGDKVFVLGRYDAIDRQTQRPLTSEWAHVFTVKDGRIAGFREFTDTAAVVESRR